jgi:4-phytase/acid phosphatase/peptide/nickel transport system substrate-binding protein
MIYTDRPAQVKRLKADPNFETLVGEGTGLSALVINTRKPPLDDVRVRRALAHAWDQKKYIQMVYKDTVPFATHWYGDKSGCSDVSYRYPDLERAKTLMREYGQPVEIEYIHSATQRGIESGLVVQQLLKPIGVQVKTVPLKWGAIAKRVFGRNFDLASWGIPGMDDMGVATQLIFHSKSPWNLSGYSNETVDALLIKQASSTDQDLREEIWCDVAHHVNQDAPVLFFCGRRYYLFASPRVKGLVPPHNQNIHISNAWLSP